MTDKKQTQQPDSSDSSLDLSALTDFQFGPSWARQNAPKVYTSSDESASRDRGRKGNFREDRFSSSRDRKPRRDFSDRNDSNRERRPGTRPGGRFDRNDRERERPPLPDPAPGLRVELRPVDLGLAACSAEVSKHKRVISLFDFAKVIMGKRDRYDLVFMKQDGGPDLIVSKKGDHACWLSKTEAVKFIWKASWFDELYEAVIEDAEPPSGTFTAIGKCPFNDELIGPVNWHGYQTALINLHRTKYSNMPLDRFKTKIRVEKSEEAVQQWLDSVCKKTVWKPRREGSEETKLEDSAAVEKDFADNHFDDVYEVTDKVFINGAVAKDVVSEGIWAHIATLSNLTRKHPSMLIPNLCHGLARHHMPIFKWKGGHHTGPSRPRTLSADTVLADRMMAIMTWVLENQGKRVDVMLKQLCGNQESKPKAEVEAAPTQEVQEAPEAVETDNAADAAEVVETQPEAVAETVEATEQPAPVSEVDQQRQELVKDLLWLCDQGYVLVFADGKVNLPKLSDKPSDPADKKQAKPKKKTKTVKEKPKAEESKSPSEEEKKVEAPALEEQPVEQAEASVAESVETEPEAEAVIPQEEVASTEEAVKEAE